MAERQVCARCGTAIRRYTASRLCPSCLLRGGLLVENGPGEKDSPPSAPLELPHSFGDYELLEVIARGGMGIVYRARQKSLNRIVAIKMLLAGEYAQPNFIERFRAEAEAVAQLQHPNIVAIHEIGEQDGRQFFSMDYVQGKNLAQVSAEFGARSAEAHRCASWLKSMAEAAHYAHQRGIIHRDLKPSNVLIDAFDQPRITDFGLAKRLTGASELTLTGQVLGSPNYLPPEQASGKPTGVGSDVYSLGAILYHLLTGRPPFEAESLTTLLRQVVETEPIPPRGLNPGIPRDLETIALKCLEKEPHRRYQTAKELAADLGRFLEGRPIQARPVNAADKVWKWCRRRPALAGMGGALLLALLLGSAGVLWQWRQARVNALSARQGEYAADMLSAHLAIAENNRGLALALLDDKYRPKVQGPLAIHDRSRTDLRNWEWRYLRQLCRGDELFTLHRFPAPVTALAVSRDGKLLATATASEVLLWDPTTRTRVASLGPGANKLVFSPAKDVLALGCFNEKREPRVDLWEVNGRKQTRMRTLKVGTREVRGLVFSADGKRLATLTGDGILQVADSDSGQILYEKQAVRPFRDSAAGVVVFLPDDRLILGEEYGLLQVLNLKTGEVASVETQTASCVSSAAFCRASGLFAAGFGYGEGSILLWNPTTWEPLGRLTNHTDSVSALAFGADGQYLVSASSDRTIRIWSVANQTQRWCLQSSQEQLTALALLADGRTLVSGGSGGSVCLWEIGSSARLPIHTNLAVSLRLERMRDVPPAAFGAENFDPKAAARFGLAFAPDSHSFITMNSGGELGVYDARSFALVESLPALGSNHWAAALSPDGRWLATGDHPGRITLWDWTNRKAATNFSASFDWFGLLRFSSSGRYFICTCARNDWSRHSVRIWRTNDWVELGLTGSQFEGLYPVDLSPDERHLAVGYVNGAIKLFYFPSLRWETTLAQNLGTVGAVLFSADGRKLISVDFGGAVRSWDVATRRQQGDPLRGHLGTILGAALSPDGRRLATGGSCPRDAVKIWDLAARREILSLNADGVYFAQVTFSPDGSTLTATSLSGTAHLWRAPAWEEIELAERAREEP